MAHKSVNNSRYVSAIKRILSASFGYVLCRAMLAKFHHVRILRRGSEAGRSECSVTSLVAACMMVLAFSNAPNIAQAAAPKAIPGCAANYSIDVTMSIGTRWEMCWDRDAQKGLVLNQVSFTPKSGSRTLVLGSAALAQIYVSYDDNATKHHYVSDNGLALENLSAADCPGGTLRQDNTGNSVACQIIRGRGYAWRGTGQVQGQSLIVYAISNIGTDTYIHQWVFNDDGTIMPMLGVSGRLDVNQISNASTGWPLGAGNLRYATSRFHTAYWRLNFDIGGSANDGVEQFDYSGSGNTRTQSVSAITSETSRAASPSAQRFWRVKDSQLTNSNGHNLSYQINLQEAFRASAQSGSEGFTQNDVYVTNNKACEQFASHNPTAGGCGGDTPGFVNGESLSDVVMWVGTTWHQMPRDEDERYVPVHWQSVTLTARFHVHISIAIEASS